MDKDRMHLLLNYSGLISSIILICALLKIYIYYKQFNISIFSFIEIQDAVVLFIDNLLGYLALVIPTIIYNVILYYKSIKLSKPGELNFITIFSQNIIVIFVFLSTLMICLTFYYFLAKKVNVSDIIFISIFYFVCLFSPYITIVTQRYLFDLKFDIQFSFIEILFFYIFIIMILFSIIIAYLEARKVKKEDFYKNVLVETKEGIITSENNYYIGKIKKYVFIYNSNDHACSVISLDKIKKMIF